MEVLALQMLSYGDEAGYGLPVAPKAAVPEMVWWETAKEKANPLPHLPVTAFQPEQEAEPPHSLSLSLRGSTGRWPSPH